MWARWLGYSVVLAALAFSAPVRADEAARGRRWLIHYTTGFAAGIEANARIHEGAWRVAVEYRPLPALSARTELSFVQLTGTREGKDARCVGVTVLPVVSWHFLRFGGPGVPSSLSLDFGYGGAAFSRGFPPGGTVLNGHSAVALGARVAVVPHLLAIAGVRAFHHSNGRGFAAENPAFDGVGLDIGVAYEVAP